MNTTDIDIRKKQKKLDRTHWMCRVQKYVFGIDAPSFYMGYCPFFWMTWLAVVLAPLIYTYRGMWWIIKSIVEKIGTPLCDCLDNLAEKRMQSAKESPMYPSNKTLLYMLDYIETYCDESEMSDPDVVAKYIKTTYFDAFSSSKINAERIRAWFLENPRWIEIARKLDNEQKERLRAKVEARLKPKAENQTLRKVVSKISLCGPLFVKLLIPTAIVIAAYGVYRGIWHLVSTFDLMEWASFTAFLVLVSCVAGAIAMLICLLGSADVLGLSVGSKFNSRCLFALDFIESVWMWCKQACEFIIDTVKMTYKAECPMIIWGDETGKIEKRNKD